MWNSICADCETIWDVSRVWERARSNDWDLWTTEPDIDRLDDADGLWSTDRETALTIYRDLADEGSVWAMRGLGRFYGWQDESASDIDAATDWYRQAIEAGSQMATLDFAQLLHARERFDECFEVLRNGVEKGFAPACFWLAWYRLKQSKSSATRRDVKPLLVYAAKEGHPQAQAHLMRFMTRGQYGVREILPGFRILWGFIGRLREAPEFEGLEKSTRNPDICLSSHMSGDGIAC